MGGIIYTLFILRFGILSERGGLLCYFSTEATPLLIHKTKWYNLPHSFLRF